ncbi:MAG: response regulator, partial [Calditrichales bacterium]
VKQNQANITIESTPGKGTSFSIYWPLAERDTMDKVVIRKSSRLQHGDETILLVDDDDAVRDLTYRSLVDLGYKVCQASDAENALDILKNKKIKPKLLVSDVIMPGMKGPELSDKILQIRPDIKVIFISGYTDDHIVHKGFLDEGVHFVQKPFAIATLSETIREVLDKK